VNVAIGAVGSLFKARDRLSDFQEMPPVLFLARILRAVIGFIDFLLVRRRLAASPVPCWLSCGKRFSVVAASSLANAGSRTASTS